MDLDRKRARDRARYARQQAALGKSVRPYRKRGGVSAADGHLPTATSETSIESVISLVEVRERIVALQGELDELMRSDAPQRIILDNNREAFQEWETRKQAVGRDLEELARQRCSVNPDQAVEALHSFVHELERLDVQADLDEIRRAQHVGDEAAANRLTTEFHARVSSFLLAHHLTPPPTDAGAPEIFRHLSAQARELEGNVDEAAAALAESRLSVLAEVRPMGGELLANDNSHPKGLLPARQAARYFPSDWIERSNEEGNLRVKYTKGRAHYTGSRMQKTRVHETRDIWHKTDQPPQPHPSQDVEKLNPSENERMGFSDSELWRITYYNVRYTTQQDATPPRGWKKHTYSLPNGEERTCFRQPRMRMKPAEVAAELTVDHSGIKCAVHELSHRMEHVGPSRIWVMQDTFVYRRAEGQSKKALFSYRPMEVGYSDDFNSPYQGRVYGQDMYRMRDGLRKPVSHYETLSTGMEAMFGGEMYSYGGLIGGRVGKKSDPDMVAHVLATLAIA